MVETRNMNGVGHSIGIARLLGLAVEAGPSGIVITDPTLKDNPIVYVNPAFERLTGYTSEEVLGRNCRFLRSPEEDLAVVEGLRAALEEGSTWTGILCNYRKDGRLFWNELHLAPVYDEVGRLANYIGIQTDVTKRLRAERDKLRASEEYRKIISLLPNAVYRWSRSDDGVMRLSYCEGALAHIFGVTTAQGMGSRLDELFPPEFIETVGPVFERSFGGETVEFPSRIGDRSFTNVVMPFEGEDGFREIIGYAVEVTGRERAEEALRKSEERYEVAIRGSNDGLWDWDLTTNEVYLSPRWKEMLGYEDHELANRVEEWERMVHPDDVERKNLVLKEYLSGLRENYEIEHRLLHRSGSYRWILARGASVRGPEGELVRMAGSHTDITERKLLEEKLRRRAFYDPLTGLSNRSAFAEKLEAALLDEEGETADGGVECVAVIFLDLDCFKGVNDSLGHVAGDRYLVEVAGRLAGCVRPADTLARLGGDEFVALLEGVDEEESLRVAGRLVNALRDPLELEGKSIIPRASAGVSLGAPGLIKPQNLMREADLAMYEAKKRGGNGYKMFARPGPRVGGDPP